MTVAEVRLWGRSIGAVAWDNNKNIANFEYTPSFIQSGIELAPFTMPLSPQIYSFPALSPGTFHGLPGLLADSLPDRFGNALIDAWLAKEGRLPESFNAVERLCYVGRRGMGALEYKPATGPAQGTLQKVDVGSLVELAGDILSRRQAFTASFIEPQKSRALKEIIKVGTSAGGARAKAIIAWNPETQEVRSGQINAGAGYSYWILKLDGVSGNIDKDIVETKGYGLIEYAYYKMALEAGIRMTECSLLAENGRRHFLTKRFDRTDDSGKIHMLSLGAIAHFDFNRTGAYSYEQAMQVMRKLNLPMSDIEEQFRRAVFNIIARNQDDHVKNITYLMDRAGRWKLSPAFDVIYSYNPSGVWTSRHQMSLNGKTDNHTKKDILEFADTASIKKEKALDIIMQVQNAVSNWASFAEGIGIQGDTIRKISNAFNNI